MGETGKFYSWEIIDEITAIKNCDKSFFEYRGSGVPKEIRWFFDSEDIQNSEQIPLILIYKDNEYKAHIEMESANHSRTRMFWKADLKKEFDEVLNDESINPLETIETENEVEGKQKKIYTTKYERSYKNREKAIKIHGTRCMVCDFDFEEAYGELGKDFIEVHHTKPLYSLEDEVEINPEEDLVCLCSNCHRMIHRRRDKILTVEELKEIMEERSVFA